MTQDFEKSVSELLDVAASFKKRMEEIEAAHKGGDMVNDVIEAFEAEDGGEFRMDPQAMIRHFRIREIGWRLFAAGGMTLMTAVCDEVYRRAWELGGCVEHRWEGIGNGDDIWLP